MLDGFSAGVILRCGDTLVHPDVVLYLVMVDRDESVGVKSAGFEVTTQGLWLPRCELVYICEHWAAI